jgi:hypothetical protein
MKARAFGDRIERVVQTPGLLKSNHLNQGIPILCSFESQDELTVNRRLCGSHDLKDGDVSQSKMYPNWRARRDWRTMFSPV